jgi:ArsR family transcriptional regulator, arsenate/arsenite/antimonite-responsive transcriptional repressor
MPDAAVDKSKNLDIISFMTTAIRIDHSRAAQLFHALSDETRLELLDLLRGGEKCVCDLQGVLGAAQSRLSFHLGVLKEAGLVADRKEGRWSYYRITPEALREVHDLAVKLQPGIGSTRSLRIGRCCG